MKKLITITFTVITAITLLVTLTACDDETEDSVLYDPPPPELIVADEFEPFPDDFEMLPGIDNLVIADNLIYFTSTANFVYNELDNGGFVSRKTRIFTVNADGTNLTELPNYSSKIIVPQEADGAEFTILAMSVDSGGNIWVAEAADYFTLHLPGDVSGEEADDWQLSYFRTPIGRDLAIRKLDSSGTEILTLDTSRFDAEQAFSSITDFSVDGDGNLYVATALAVYVMDSTGDVLFNLNLRDHLSDRIINLHDGNIAFLSHSGQQLNIQKIDVVNMAWGESTALPSNARNADSVFAGGGEFFALFIDGFNLYGADTRSGEAVRLINLLDTFSPDTVENVLILPDGRIMLTNEFWGVNTREIDLHILTIIPPAETAGIVTLRVATFFAEGAALQNAVREFNNNSTTHRIEIADYGRYDFGADGWAWGEGINRLAMDIITGNAPDIIEITWVPFNQWAARGLFVDLNPFLEADPELSRSDLKDNVLRNTEIGGNLYFAFPNFTISTVYGHPSVVGENMGWNWEEFNAVINANPQADMPISLFFMHTREEFLSDWLNRSMGNFVDWENGTAHFYRSDFIELLEFAKNFYESADFGTISIPNLVASGRTLMSAGILFDFEAVKWALWSFGGELSFRGYPMDNRNGNFISPAGNFAITTQSADENAAWEFVRIFLTEEFQRENFALSFFPTNRAFFDYKLEQAMAENQEERPDGIVIPPLTQPQAEQILALINSASFNRGADDALRNIVMESALDFINGNANAEDTVRVVQSRASIFMAEQAG